MTEGLRSSPESAGEQVREIKFRAWNGKKPEMFYLGDLAKVRWDILYIFKHYKVMQYTGLQDRNGVEIYEGDVIAYWKPQPYGSSMKASSRKAVEWVKNQRLHGWNIGSPRTRGGEGSQMNWEVIGNIYENPELLKGGDAEAQS